MTNTFDNIADFGDVLNQTAFNDSNLEGVGLEFGSVLSAYQYSFQYTTSYTSALSQNLPNNQVNLSTVATFYQEVTDLADSVPNVIASQPPYTINLSVLQQVIGSTSLSMNQWNQIQSWWTALTGNNPPLANLDLKGIVETLSNDGYILLTPTTSASALDISSFNTAVSAFFHDALNFGSASAYADYFNSNFLNVVAGTNTLATDLPVQFLSPSGNAFTFPLPIGASKQVKEYYAGADITDTTGPPAQNFYNNFQMLIQNTGVTPGGLNLMDFQNLTVAQQKSLFSQSFGMFLQYYEQNPLPQGTNYYSLWEQQAPIFAMAAISQPGSTYSTVLNAQYQELFNVYFPNSPSAFLPEFLQFVTAYDAQTGTAFQPGATPPPTFNSQGVAVGNSPALQAWSDVLSTASGLPNISTPQTGGSGYDAGGYGQLLLVMQVYDALLNLLNQMQIMTAQQLENQTFWGEYQNAYTQLENDVPDITGAGTTQWGKLFDGYPSQGTPDYSIVQIRSDITNLGAQFTESIKSFRSEVQDFSQAQNTAVNQSQEAVTQVVNVAQTLIQQFGTILQSIWR